MEHPKTRGFGTYVGAALMIAAPFGVYYVYPIRVVVLVSLLALLFAVVLGAPVDYLARRGLGRAWGLLAVAAGLFLLLQLAEIAATPLVAQSRRLIGDLPGLLTEVRGSVRGLPLGLGNGLAPLIDPTRIAGALRGSGLSAATVLDVGASAANLVSFGIVALLTGLFAVLYPAPLVGGFVALFPAGGRQRAWGVLAEVYGTVQRWFVGQLADMAIMGLLSAVALWIIGVPFALVLGVLSGVLGFVPYVGFAVSLVPPALLALANDPIDAAWVLVAYVLLQQAEQGLIYPLLMRRAVRLHPAVVVFALFVSSLLFGFLGLVLAVPLAAASQVLVRRLWVEEMDRSGVDPKKRVEREPMSQKAERRPVEGNGPVVEPRATRRLRWLPTAIVLANVLCAGYLTAQSLAGTGHHTGSTGVIGALLFAFTLLPSNLSRFAWWSRRRWARVLAGLRKPLGVSAGAWFVAHSVVGVVEYFDFSTTASVLGQLWVGDMAVGVAAALVFVALIATSTDAARRRLGKNWKRLQRLVWFAVPLALVHAALSSARLYHLEPPGVLLFGLPIFFVAFEYYALGRRRGLGTRAARTHAALVAAGLATAGLIYALSWLTVGPWDLISG